MKKHKTTACLLSAFMVLLLLFPLSSCTPQNAGETPAEVVSLERIYATMSREEFWDLIPRDMDVVYAVDAGYKCFTDGHGKGVLVNDATHVADGIFAGQEMLEIFICEQKATHTVEYLEKNLQIGASFLEVVAIAGIPIEDVGSGVSILVFQIADEQRLCTTWHKTEDGSKTLLKKFWFA